MKHKRRAKGDGAIYERGDGRWVYVASFGRDRTTGARRRRAIYARSRSELIRKIADERTRGGGSVKLKKREPGTIGDFLKTWLDKDVKPNRARSTLELYRHVVEKWVEPIVGEARIATFGPDDVRELHDRMRQKGASQQMCFQAWKVLHAAFELRRKTRLIANPVSIVDRPTHKAREIRVLSAPEVRKVLKAARGDRLEALWIVLLTTGIRLGEALALTWDDIDFERRVVHVRRAASEVSGVVEIGPTKTKRSRRTLPLIKPAMDALKRRRADYDKSGLVEATSLVWSTSTGRPWLRSNLRRRFFEPLLERAKVSRVTIHSMRHAVASTLAESGTPVKTVAEILGHTKPGVALQHYIHAAEDAQRQAFRRLERTLSKR